MRNIIRIFTSDAKRLATNVVAVVMIIGLNGYSEFICLV